MVECSWKSEYGINCLTCGAQRSLKLLEEGEVVKSIEMYPALIPFLIVIALVATHLIFKLKRGSELIVSFFILTVLLVVVNFSLNIDFSNLH